MLQQLIAIVKADALLDGYVFEGNELLFLPGGPGHKSYYECNELLRLLKEYDKKNNRIAAICAAPSILGNLGLLEGKKAMAFPGFFTCRTGDELHIRRMAQNPRRCNRGITDTVFFGQHADFLVQLQILVTSKEASLP